MKLTYQPLGTSSLVGIETDNETERMGQYYSFWNHGATSGRLIEMSKNFHYITSSEEKLERYFVNSSFHLLLNKFPEKYKGVKGGVMDDAKKLAKRRFEELKENSEVFYSTQLANYDYSVSKSEPLVVQSSGVANDEEAWKQNSVNVLAASSAKRLG
tara:strand:+ start:3635 stop:4105 length:471 start_codon:yes stop_codon:yes gene_type:complete